MLERLSVENYALIEKLDLELSPSLNIITGETGAGKSILLGALGLILGNRTDGSVLKDAGKNCVIEGVFNLDGCGLQSFFEENDLEYDTTTVVRRIITPAGKSRAYVNDIPVQLTSLRELSLRLIDIHSQNQSELIGDENFRIRVIDSLADNRKLLADYSVQYESLCRKERELSRMKEELAQSRRDEEYMRSQWEQLVALGLKADELQELEAEQSELANAGDILAALAVAAEGFGAEETGALPTVKVAAQSLQHISNVLEQAGALAERLESVYVEMKDIDAEISSLAGRIESNPARLEAVDNRLGSIYALLKRHKVETAEELIAIENDLRNKLEVISGAGENLSELEAKIASARAEAVKIAAKITTARIKAAAKLDGEVGKVLQRLGMAAAIFATEVTSTGILSATGGDTVRFLFNANRDATLQPLERVASGGETSRVMLALKSIVARSTMLPTIIFDEIDTGVSGRIADVTGDIIAELGTAMQVVNITHLPQVASKGDTHFLVYKRETASGITTRISRLNREERVEEIAKMLSGSEVTAAAISQARSLLGYDKQGA